MDKKEYNHSFLPKKFTPFHTMERFNTDRCNWNIVPDIYDRQPKYEQDLEKITLC